MVHPKPRKSRYNYPTSYIQHIVSQLLPTDLRYPEDDERFERPPSSLTLTQACAWTDAMPPSPEFNPAEQYGEFTKRQTAYASYRNAVVETRDKLKRAEGQLLIPKAPVGEDIQEAIKWVSTTGATPLEFLTKTYRDSSQQMGHRIAAASKLMEFIHRRMPTAIEHNPHVEVTAKSIDPTYLKSLNSKELETLEALLDKLAKQP